jgi:nucleoside-diphosphate-sugar epimerase
MSHNVLVLGASGRFGRHAAEAFWNAGWRVRVFDRKTDDLAAAALEADVIVIAWNPPYTDWAREVPRLTAEVIAAAKSSGATVLIPGNVYGYGAGSEPLIDAASPKSATNPMGRIRNEMEAAYREAGVPTIVLRAGDFLDTQDGGNWFESVIAAKAGHGRMVSPGDPDIPHAWAFLPDMARAAVMLAEKREALATFEEVLFPGYTLSLSELAELVSMATGRIQKVRRFEWLPLRLAAPFWPMARRLLEMRYLWFMPHRISGERMAELLPDFRATDPLTAIGQTVAHLQIDPDQTMARGASHIAAE